MKRFAPLAAVLLLLSGSALAVADTDPNTDPAAPCYKWPAGDWDKDGVVDRLDRCPNTPPGCSVDAYGCSLDADHDGVCDNFDKCPDTPKGVKVDKHGCSADQRAAMNAPAPTPPPPPAETKAEPTSPPPPPPPPPPAPAPTETEKTLVETGTIRLENVYFETGSAKLKSESEQALNDAGSALQKYPDLEIEVQGHTDKRGSAALNMKLSQARAEAVRQYLIDHFQLNPDHVTAKGYGETRPETAEKTAAEMQRDRRVILKVLNPSALPGSVKIEK
ncbi:MAG TPA: OmpA family protein [Candidatus Acidoferrales bacterium]|nr:OmpA family protein [Candidatus Acidoferrales bacterium]